MGMIQPSTIVKLLKFDNQSRQYKEYCTLYISKEQMEATGKHLIGVTQVHEFYKYEWEWLGQKWELFSVSPAVFDHIQTPVI